MLVKWGTAGLKKLFIEQLTECLHSNYVVDTNRLPAFEGQEVFIEYLLSYGDIAVAGDNDVLRQKKIDEERAVKALADMNAVKDGEDEAARLWRAMEGK